MDIDKRTYEDGLSTGAWFALDHILGWINTFDHQSIDKKELYKMVIELRPEIINGLEEID